MANNHRTLSWWYGDLAGAITFTLAFKKLTAVWMTSLQMTDCTTLVLSRQSMQLMRKTPDWTHRGLVPLTMSSLDKKGQCRRFGEKEWRSEKGVII